MFRGDHDSCEAEILKDESCSHGHGPGRCKRNASGKDENISYDVSYV